MIKSKCTHHLAIDLGSSTTRLIMFKFNDYTLTQEEVIYKFKTFKIQENGSIYWDYKKIFKNILIGLKKINNPISTIGIDSWGVDFAYIDKDLNILDKIYCYRDSKSLKVWNKNKFSFFKYTGIIDNPGNSSFQINRDLELRPKIVEKAKYILNISDLFNFMLSNRVFNEFSISKTTQILENNEFKIHKYISKFLKIDHIIFKPKELGYKIGKLKNNLIKNENLKETDLIIVGGHDTASALVPLSMNYGDLFVSLGSWVIVGQIIKSPIINEVVKDSQLSNEGDAFGRTKFLKNINGLYLLQRISDELNITFSEIINFVKNSVYPHWFDPNSNIIMDESKTLLERIDLYCSKKNIKKPHSNHDYIKMIYNSLINLVKITIKQIVDITKIAPKRIVLFGGGLRDKFLVDSLHKEIGEICNVETGPIESTSFGNAIIQILSTYKMGISDIKNIKIRR